MATREELLAAAKEKLDRENLLAAARAKLDAQSKQESGPSLPEQIETAGGGLLSGMTFGASEPAVAGINALLGKGMDMYLRSKEEAQGIPQAPEQSLSDLYAQEVEKRKRLKDEASGANLVGELAGAFTPGGAGGLLMKGVGKAVQGAGALSKLGKLAPVAEEAIKGAAVAAGQAGTHELIGEPTGFVKPGEEKGIGEQALMGAGLGAAIPAAGVAIGAIGSGAKMAAKTLFGVNPKAVERFLANPQAVLEAKSPEQIRELAQQAVEKIKQAESVSKLDLTDNISTGLASLKSQIIDASENAYGALEASSVKVPLSAVKDAIRSGARELEKPGFVGPAFQDAKDKIKNFVNSLDGLPEEIDGVTLKRIVKSLDADLDFLSHGEFAGSKSQSVMLQARGEVDSLLKKTYPAYKEAITPVRELSQFHDEVFKSLSTPDKIFDSLTRLGKPGKEIKDARLQKLFKQTGIDPERFRQAQEDAAMFKTWDTTATAEQKIKAMMNEKSDAVKEQFKRLGELSETDFIKEIENLSAKTAFEKEFVHGSRNVNLWTFLGGGTGGLVGGGVPGAMMGAVAGSMIDKYGPKMAQQVLIGYANLKGIPTVQKINQVFGDLPPDLKKEITEGFTRAVISQKKDVEPTFIPTNMRPQVASEIRNARYLSAQEKAKMLSSLNKYGEVPAFSRVFIGKEKPSVVREQKQTKEPTVKSVTDYVKSQKEAY